MKLSEEELIKIEEYSALFLNYEEIAVLLEKEIESFKDEIQNTRSKAYYAYLKGKTKTKKQMREKIITMAIKGSPNAEIMVNKFIIDQEISEI